MTAPAYAAVRADTPLEALKRALNYDLAQPLAFTVLAVVYVISRAPWIDSGYGTDPDAWRMAMTGHWLWDHGEYYPSRLPGYPLPEMANAMVIKGGWVATNLLTVAVSLLGLWFFARIVRRLELPNRALVVAGFAFTPLLWINSMTTMDYMYALTFLLGAYYFLLTGDSFLAGIMLGLAVASRLTTGVMLVPALAYLLREGRRNEIRPFVVSVAFITLAAWGAIYWQYSLAFLDFYDADVGYLNVLRLLAKDCLGLIGAAAVVAAAAVSWRALARLPADAVRDKDVMFWLIAIAMTVIVFLRLPHEAAYLIPVYPFGFLLMARYFSRAALGGAIAAIVLAGFIDVTTPGDEITASSLREAELGKGLVLSNDDTMDAQMDFARRLDCPPKSESERCVLIADDGREFEIPDNSYVMLGFIYPEFAVLHRDRLDIGLLNDEEDNQAVSMLSDNGWAIDQERQVHYVWLLDYEEFSVVEPRYWVLFTLDASRSVAALYDYRPGFWCERQPVEDDGTFRSGCAIDLGRGPSGGSGAARTDR